MADLMFPNGFGLAMSNDGELKIWVRDLDRYISIRGDEECEAGWRSIKYDGSQSGEIQLLSDKSIAITSLNAQGVLPSEWRLAIHKAEHALQSEERWPHLEGLFIKDLISLGKLYAVARYSKWEKLYYPTALTATFPHGFRALLDRFLAGEQLLPGSAQNYAIQEALQLASKAHHVAAYHRVGMIQSAIHKIAADIRGSSGQQTLGREGMRTMLSLARLHYSAAELRVGTLRELQLLEDLYSKARRMARGGASTSEPCNGRHIRNWELRHLHPLTYFYPYAIRNALTRGRAHFAVTTIDPTRSTLLNELALARCNMLLMKRNTTSRGQSR